MATSSQMHILGIIGSPRRGGNTELLVDEVLAGAKETGALSEKIILNEMNINPCQACNDCYKTGHCKQEDDKCGCQSEGSIRRQEQGLDVRDDQTGQQAFKLIAQEIRV